ncbi:hypothetical protein GZ141_07955 [Staphylococcus aureus]|nr:hypothetical protein [Staphylococcus aureus]
MMKIKVEKEMKIDELIKWARENPELKQVEEFESVSERGEKGFGSSGV